MKRIAPAGSRVILAVSLVLFFLPVLLQAQAKTMSVIVREAQARDSASFLGKIVAVLAYGDQVTVLEERSGWMHIKINKTGIAAGTTAWVHSSALTQKKVALKAGQQSAGGASGTEVALAGKGFNKQVEDKYKAENNLDYSWVDRMEAFVTAPDELAQFIDEGGLLASGEGGAL